jgi:diacylglycerol kinase family enzyme
VKVDGSDYDTTWIIAANGRNYAGTFVLAPGAKLSEPGLHAVLFSARSRTGRLLELLTVAAGLHTRLPGVKILPCARVEVAEPGIAVQVDGDPVAHSPVTITSTGSALRLIAPQSYVAA